MIPKRIQRRRKKGWQMPEGAIYVGRGRGRWGKWGNPYRIVQEVEAEYYGNPRLWCAIEPWGQRVSDWGSKTEAIEAAISRFRDEVGFALKFDPCYLEPLRGCDLVCWCPLDQPCHADVLIELANRKRGSINAIP